MKYIKPFNETIKPLLYSGGDVTKMPIIGTIITKPFKVKFGETEHVIPSDTCSIVEIITPFETGKEIYVTNKWYNERKRIPALIHVDMVESKSF